MRPEPLMTRDEFREAVFQRDGHTCLVCHAPAADAHHLLERRLWTDGGYYLSNGASVCEPCHLRAEQTLISVEELRTLAGVKRAVLPPHLYDDQPYDKWGNPVQPNGTRLKGELFEDESVQKVLAQGGVLGLFTEWVKYPRTHHVEWSPGNQLKDERTHQGTDWFCGQDCVVTLKQDGENTSMYRDYLHARSLDYSPHPSRNLIKALHAQICGEIPKGWRLVGENLFAKHSIHYQNLESYFQLFSVWDERNNCLSWDETCEWAELLNLKLVPVWKRFVPDHKSLRILPPHLFRGDPCEGFVIRTAAGFHYRDFKKHVAKWVRAGHINHDSAHWRLGQITPNTLNPTKVQYDSRKTS